MKESPFNLRREGAYVHIADRHLKLIPYNIQISISDYLYPSGRVE